MRIALLQSAPQPPDPVQALACLDRAAARAAAGGARLLLTPEMFLTGYNIGPHRARALAEPADGASAAAAAALARRHGIALLYGYPELGGDGAVYNSVNLIDAAGARLATHRKTHLFGGVDAAQFSPGAHLAPPVWLDGWRVGLAICYEVEFPELVRASALAGTELLLVPTANMAPFASVCTRMVPARAEENSIFVAYANYIGHEGDFAYCGLSCICAPDGDDLARGTPDQPGLLFADLDRDRLSARRRLASHLTDRRPELYRSAEV